MQTMGKINRTNGEYVLRSIAYVHLYEYNIKGSVLIDKWVCAYNTYPPGRGWQGAEARTRGEGGNGYRGTRWRGAL